MEIQSVFASLPYGFLFPLDGLKACWIHVSKQKKIPQIRHKTFFGEKYILRYILQNITDFSPSLTPWSL